MSGEQAELDYLNLQRELKKLKASHSDLHLRYRLIVDKFRCETAARVCSVLSHSLGYERSAKEAVRFADTLISELEKSRVDSNEDPR